MSIARPRALSRRTLHKLCLETELDYRTIIRAFRGERVTDASLMLLRIACEKLGVEPPPTRPVAAA